MEASIAGSAPLTGCRDCYGQPTVDDTADGDGDEVMCTGGDETETSCEIDKLFISCWLCFVWLALAVLAVISCCVLLSHIVVHELYGSGGGSSSGSSSRK